MWDKCYRAYQVYDKIKKAGSIITGLAVMAMMFFITADILGRNFIGYSIPGNYELVQGYLMPLVSYPALAYAYAEGVMPRVGMLIDKLPHKEKKITIISMLVLDIALFVTMVAFTWQFAVRGLVDKTGFVAGLRVWPVYPLFFIVPICFVMVIIENIFVIIRNLSEDKAEYTTQYNEEVNIPIA